MKNKGAKRRFFRELRCPVCRKLFLKEYIFDGRIEIKCTNCKPKRIISFIFKSARNVVEYEDLEQD